MRVETITPPAYTAVLLDEVKDHLRIDGSDEDAALGALSVSACTLVESWLDLALVDRTVAIYLDAWPKSAPKGNDPWWDGVADGAITLLTTEAYHTALPLKPVRSISTIEITASDDTSSVWGADNYYLKPGISPVLARKYGKVWPNPGVPVDGIKITATAGFGPDWNSVPAGIRQALLMLIAHQYYNRGDETTEPLLRASGAEALLTPYREMRI